MTSTNNVHTTLNIQDLLNATVEASNLFTLNKITYSHKKKRGITKF